MGTRVLLVLSSAAPKHFFGLDCRVKTLDFSRSSSSPHFYWCMRKNHQIARNFSSDTMSGEAATISSSSLLQPPDVPRLAETARISLTPAEVEEFAPKIQQVVDWFGQLQAIDLNTVEPTIRADMEGENLRDDIPETFQNGDAIRASVPSFEEPYIKVPRVLNKE